MLRYLLIFFPLFSGNLINAQQILTISENIEKVDYIAISDCQIDYLFTLYNRRVDASNEIINGREYFPYYYRSEIKPLLFNEKKKSGSLLMKGRKYENLALDYDTNLDELIYSDRTKFIFDKMLMIALNSEQVDGFNLNFEDDTLIFRHFRSGDSIKFNIPEGYYELVYDGKSKYIIKHHSSITKEKSLNVYLYSPTGYVMVGKNFSKLRSRRGFVKLFGVKSAEIKKFMRSKRIHVRKEDKNKIASVLRYYDTLIFTDK